MNLLFLFLPSLFPAYAREHGCAETISLDAARPDDNLLVWTNVSGDDPIPVQLGGPPSKLSWC